MGRAKRPNNAVSMTGFDQVFGGRRGSGPVITAQQSAIRQALLDGSLDKLPGGKAVQYVSASNIADGSVLMDETHPALVRALYFGHILKSAFYVEGDFSEDDVYNNPDDFKVMNKYEYASPRHLTQAACASPHSRGWIAKALPLKAIYEHVARHAYEQGSIISSSGVEHDYSIDKEKVFLFLKAIEEQDLSRSSIAEKADLNADELDAHTQWLTLGHFAEERPTKWVGNHEYTITPEGEHLLAAAKRLGYVR